MWILRPAKFYRQKCVEMTWIFQTSKLHQVRWNDVDLSNIEITSKKVRGNNVDFSTSEITLKKVGGNEEEMTWKFVEIWSST